MAAPRQKLTSRAGKAMVRKYVREQQSLAEVSIRPSDAQVMIADPNTDTDYGETGVAPATSIAGGVAPTTNDTVVSSDDNNALTTHVSPTLSIDNPDPNTDIDTDDVEPPVMNAKMRRLMDMAIVTELVAGTPLEVIAKNYKVDLRYTQRVRGEWLKACKLQETMDYRHDLKVLSIEAIREGLQAKGDPFKRASAGIRVMQGIGEFKPDTINLNVLQRLENVPSELRNRFITSSPEDEAAVQDAEIVVHDNDKG